MTKIHDVNEISDIETTRVRNTENEDISDKNVTYVTLQSRTNSLESCSGCSSLSPCRINTNSVRIGCPCKDLEKCKHTNENPNLTGNNCTQNINILDDNHIARNNVEEQEVHTALDLEKEQHERSRDQRIKFFEKIISNRHSNIAWKRYTLYIIATILICSVAPFTFTLIPAHNVILCQGYWYEPSLQFFSWCIYMGAYIVYHSVRVLNIDYINGARYYLASALVGIVGYELPFLISSLVWTKSLRFSLPLPFHTMACGFCGVLASMALTNLSFPRDWRKDRKFKIRLKWLNYGVIYVLAIVFQYNAAAVLLHYNKNEYQPAIALVFILLREVNGSIISKFVSKTAGGDEFRAEDTGSILIGIQHTILICYTLGSIATYETGMFFMVSDIILSLVLCLKLVWVRKRRPENTKEQIDLIRQLVLAELLEIMVTLTFLITCILAFYGPNSKLIGGIEATIWHYEAIEDMPAYLKTVLTLFTVDFSCAIVSSVLLWLSCRINLFVAFMAMEKEHGVYICVCLGNFITSVSS